MTRHAPAPVAFTQRSGVFCRLCGHLGDYLRWLLLMLLVTAGLAGGWMYFVQNQLDEEIRLYLEAKLRAHYPELLVHVRSARRINGKGIEIRGVSLAYVRDEKVGVPIVQIDELFAECSTDLAALSSGTGKPRRVQARGVKLRAVKDAGGAYSLFKLWPPPRTDTVPPPLFIQQGVLELLDEAGGRRRSFLLKDMELAIVPRPSAVAAVGNTAPAPAVHIRGELASDRFRTMTVDGRCDLAAGSWSVTGSAEHVQIGAEVVDSLPVELADRLAVLRNMPGTVDVSFEASSANTGAAVAFRVAGDFAGRVEDHRLPQPLSDVRARFEFGPRRLSIADFRARAGRTQVRGSAVRQGWSSASPFQASARIDELVLDERLKQSLPAEFQAAWRKISPRGTVDVQVSLDYDGQQLGTVATVDLLDTSFSYEQFPYRVDNVRGQLRYADQQLTIDSLHGAADGRPVEIKGVLGNLTGAPTGWLDLLLAEPLAIDDRLFDALPLATRDVVRSLHPHGAITAWGRYERLTPRDPPHKRLEMRLHDCSVRYEKFPYPIHDIHGTVSMTDNVWSVRDLHGVNGGAWILCNGGWARDPGGVMRLEMDFFARRVALEDELRDALDPRSQQLWNDLRPRGTLDQLAAKVHYDSQSRRIATDVTLTKRPSSENPEGRDINLQPVWLPYAWNNVSGVVHANHGRAEFQRVRGVHGETTIALGGVAERQADGVWTVQLQPVEIERLTASHELLSSLPPRLAQALAKLNLNGPFHLSGGLTMTGAQGQSLPVTTAWDLLVDLEGTDVDCGVRVDDLRGNIRLVGGVSPRGLYSRGELALDSVLYRGLQWTGVSGPLSLDDSRLAFGEWVRTPQGEAPPGPVRGNLFGGTLIGSAHVYLNEDSPFEIEGNLFDGDLATIAREVASSRNTISGRTYASVRLTGSGRGSHTLRGRGQVQLRQADIYELPIMIRLLSLLSIQRPDGAAFTSSDVDFRIEADRVYLDRVVFEGDVISMEGLGELQLPDALNLAFTTQLGRPSYRDLILQPLLNEAGRGLLRIEVTGTIADPLVRRQAVPELNDALRQLFPGLRPPAEDDGGSTETAGPRRFRLRR